MLRESDELYRLLAENSTDVISKHTVAGVLTYVSPACRSLLGYEPEELVGRSVYELFHPEDLERIEDAHSAVLDRLDTYTVDYRIRRKDGSYTWFETTGRAVREPATGGVLELIAVSRDVSERKRAEEALRESNERTTNILESIAEAFFAVDRSWRFTYLNRQAERVLNKTREELLGRNFWEEFPKAVGSTFSRKYHEAMGSGTPVHFEEFYPPLGVWAEVHAYPSGEGLAVYFCDVTERKRSEEARRASEERYRALYEDNPTMYFTLDGEGTLLSVNRFGAERLGYAPDELVGRSVLDLFYEGDREAVARRADALLRGPERLGVWEARKARKDGSTMWVEETARVVEDSDGNRTVLIVCAEVTERKRTEETLRDSEERYRAFFETAAVGAAETDPTTGRMLRVNDYFCRFLGYGREELLTMNFFEVTHPEDRARDSEGMARLLRGELREYITEKRYLRKDGGVVWAQRAVALVRDANGRPLHYVAIAQDITERKRAEEALAREVRAKSDFLAEVSHELRTPLTVIRGSADVGLELARDWPHADLLREILEESSTMSRMVEDLLFLARSDSDSPPLDPKTIPVERLLGGVARRAEALAREHGSSLRTELSGEGRLKCDPGRIEQATLVLVDNAVKYGPPGEHVTLSSSTQGGELLVEVVDRGPGIPPEELSRIFERFYRGEGSSGGRGSGLGLPIARTIVRAHGGRLEAESRVGRGTRMSLHLPLTEGS